MHNLKWCQDNKIINCLRSFKNKVWMIPHHKPINCNNKAISKNCWFNKIPYWLRWLSLTSKMRSHKSNYAQCAPMKNIRNKKDCYRLKSCNRRVDNKCHKAPSFYRSKLVGIIRHICLCFQIWIKRKGPFQHSNRYQGGQLIANSASTPPNTLATKTYSSKWSRVTHVWSN